MEEKRTHLTQTNPNQNAHLTSHNHQYIKRFHSEKPRTNLASFRNFHLLRTPFLPFRRARWPLPRFRDRGRRAAPVPIDRSSMSANPSPPFLSKNSDHLHDLCMGLYQKSIICQIAKATANKTSRNRDEFTPTLRSGRAHPASRFPSPHRHPELYPPQPYPPQGRWRAYPPNADRNVE